MVLGISFLNRTTIGSSEYHFVERGGGGGAGLHKSASNSLLQADCWGAPATSQMLHDSQPLSESYAEVYRDFATRPWLVGFGLSFTP